MKLVNSVVLLSAFFVVAVHSKKLPSYIKPCSIKDPNFGDCAVAHGQAVIPLIQHGEPSFHVPSLQPFRIERIEIKPGRNFYVNLTDMELYGLETVLLRKYDYDLENNRIRIAVEIPHLNLLANYSMQGQVLILRLVGNGLANLTFDEGFYDFSFDAVLEERGGKRYITVVNPQLEYDIPKRRYHFDNLFGGNRIGVEVNNFINENWREINKEFRPTITETITKIITAVTRDLFGQVPVDELFKDYPV